MSSGDTGGVSMDDAGGAGAAGVIDDDAGAELGGGTDAGAELGGGTDAAASTGEASGGTISVDD